MKSTNKSVFALLAMAMFAILFTSCDHEKAPPAQVLEYDEANRLEETFAKTRGRVIDASLGYPDTRDFWFSLDSLKKYIEYVEYEAGKRGNQDLGIRVYFAAYPANSSYPEAGYSTVFMTPTYRSGDDGVKRGFFPTQPTNQNMDSIPAFNYGSGGFPPNNY